ncbi:helix-turn-helix transcriptional regulator [Roseibium sp. M-1]
MTDHTGTSSTRLDADAIRRQELGAFLRAARERMTVSSTERRRRTPGLRREEVADAAAISVVWYTWLEQGRDVRMSPETLARLVRALELNRTEALYLRTLARPDDLDLPSLQAAPGAVSDLVTRLSPHPAYALDRTWNVVACNGDAANLVGPFVRSDPVRGNVLARLFLDPDWKRLFCDWGEVARMAAAQFRASTAAFATEADVVSLLSRLHEVSPDFARIWTSAEIAPAADWTKTILSGGRVTRWRHSVLRPEGAGRDFSVTVYLPA